MKLEIRNWKLEIFQRGFTLIEVVVASAIFTFVAVMAIGIFAQTSRASDKVNADREISQAARFAFEQFSRSVRGASHLNIMQNGSAPTTVCPADFVVPKVGTTGQALCGNEVTVTASAGGVTTTETFGLFKVATYYCFARITGAVFNATKDACITPPTVDFDPANFLLSGYVDQAVTDVNQKPYAKIRVVTHATQRLAGAPVAKRYTYETTIVARNDDKQY
ncbi:type II secretion system protein [Candidatus Berkelbacteria bacterium]|nr:type II secretion system protein [Candidatus Berkelbacteria bacterium]